MHDDSKNEEISVSVKASKELTGFGLEAKAKSRAVSAFDRLIGDGASYLGNYFRRSVSENQSDIEAKAALKSAAVTALAAEVLGNPELAADILGIELSQAARRHSNKESVVLAAMEQLKIAPPSDAQQNDGPEALSEDFLNRFERHAEDASADNIQEKWASVLASEVRQPGTFNNRVMRILDEVDVETAMDFNKLSGFQISGSVPKCLHKITFSEEARFEEYGLLKVSGLGVVNSGLALLMEDGSEFFCVKFENLAIVVKSLDVEATINKRKGQGVIFWNDLRNAPEIPVYLPTTAGACLFGIVEDKSVENAKRLLEELRELGLEVRLLKAESGRDGEFVDTMF
ncbi:MULTISPECIES: DUF2806 domain-containing protein [Falsihalocynthiibacter]|uniref:DUF2806 domain-containing protein n=1 Tax=Falsihalocynthiibacter TaxID=2854182 RepID=UPI003002D05A